MFGIGTGELVMILIIAMLVVGPEKMVQLSKQFGQLVAKFRQQTESVTQEFREALTLEMDDKDEGEAAPQLPSGTEIQPASAPPAEAASPAVAESAAELAPAAVAAEPAPEDQITPAIREVTNLRCRKIDRACRSPQTHRRPDRLTTDRQGTACAG